MSSQSCDAGEAGTGTNGVCEACAVGQSRKAGTNATRCTLCDLGRYQPETGQASCLPCIPGRYNDLTGQTACPPCAKNTISSEPASTSCVSCGVGEFAEEGSARSQRCGAGTYGNGCLKCPLETARDSSDPDVTQCRQCKLGETTTIVGAAVCDKW